MFLAAFTSACAVCPQVVHRYRAWLSRDAGSTLPHSAQRCDVNAGGTLTIWLPL
jgi:hypothetical protein